MPMFLKMSPQLLDFTPYSRLGHAHAQYPWTEYMLPRIIYVLLIEETMFTVRNLMTLIKLYH
jgi:hypothetical protein